MQGFMRAFPLTCERPSGIPSTAVILASPMRTFRTLPSTFWLSSCVLSCGGRSRGSSRCCSRNGSALTTTALACSRRPSANVTPLAMPSATSICATGLQPDSCKLFQTAADHQQRTGVVQEQVDCSRQTFSPASLNLGACPQSSLCKGLTHGAHAALYDLPCTLVAKVASAWCTLPGQHIASSALCSQQAKRTIQVPSAPGSRHCTNGARNELLLQHCAACR